MSPMVRSVQRHHERHLRQAARDDVRDERRVRQRLLHRWRLLQLDLLRRMRGVQRRRQRRSMQRSRRRAAGSTHAVRRERQCVIVGRPGWRCETTIARLRAATADGERVLWLNGVEDETRLQHIYAGAGVFVFPSLHEGFGMPLTEAFACGVPVVTANTTSLPEVAQGAALEVDPLDVGAIADAMLTLVRDDALRQRCIAAGTRRVQALTWANTAQMTAAVYRKVLAG